MKRIVLLLAIAAYVLQSYGQGELPSPAKLQDNVGNIKFDPKLDDPSFKPCDAIIYQYYGANTRYNGGQQAVKKYLKSMFKYKPAYSGTTGYVTIRFVVNCKGQTGWFRVMQVDDNYRRVKFNKELVKNLLTLTRKLNSWIPGSWDGKAMDTYYYLNFKLINGHIKDITP